MIQMIQKYNTPEVIVDQGLFTVFRQMQLEDQVEQVHIEGDAGAEIKNGQELED